ncbi:MAG TPA: UDP-2,3-diacylglucosamine diphosphatase LpxI [Geminicoccaceae bacterium]|nr:UDP-2,3-diacylglucosamine diphosphatase LpxI [Geminicoccus sp.]HMU53332.1 UDP-2,3-diacylglucosamine diphosphatase LpxI [Geminicoccaceae bacterium]
MAGAGPLPRLVAQAATSRGRRVFTLGLDGITDRSTTADRSVPLGSLGAALTALREARLDEVVLAGPVPRPRLTDLRPDLRAARLMARLMLGRIGDDAALRAVIAAIEEEGMRVIGADAAAPELLAPAGALGKTAPMASAFGELPAGIAGCRELGDAGQAVVVQGGAVIGREGRDGTDALLAGSGGCPGGILVKLPKPHQDRRVDLPTIGPRTVELAAAAGLRGLFVEAGGTLVVDRPATVAAADRAGLFVFGIVPG